MFNCKSTTRTSDKDNTRVQKEILPFVTQYNQPVPNLKHILMEKWHLLESQPKLKEMFKEPH